MATMTTTKTVAPPPPPAFTALTSLSKGGKILFATDEWFAAADNLLSPTPPVFIAEKFTDFGKWMDGWESRRKRIPGHDWCIIELGLRGKIVGIDVDTAFFTGNNAPQVSIQAACLEPHVGSSLIRPRRMGTSASDDEFKAVEALQSAKWTEILPRSSLGPGYEATRHNYFEVESDQVFTHLRLNMFPDGGIARLHVYGIVSVDWSKIDGRVDLVAAANGGTAIYYSDAHYGEPRNLLNPGRGVNMGDGWETARKKTRPSVLTLDPQGLLQVPGSDFVVLKLGHVGIPDEVEVDTAHFKGNFPESCLVEGCLWHGSDDLKVLEHGEWTPLFPRTKLTADAIHRFQPTIPQRPINYIRLTIFPDGGISRFRLFGVKANPSRL
ncbi:unnamed protein product [Aphanomyces euteiches]|uniref:Allantoicase domain-containing protein n=1 Tax=Aphanomyces euteiches TaxID=100861 RepID=A0A6G0X0E9_9STRA|nr:hypothetical protein Ae201684_009833 [Aphanomyces euteiches]KAH9095855.1 hypothetical protein Ae201684P_010066 [Aphanomyces euteiches]KAH9143937.1 hypothetical protein AeRB84_012097 [Aphanomyces euteiches]